MMKIGRCASVLSDAEKRIGTVKYRILFSSKPEATKGYAIWCLSVNWHCYWSKELPCWDNDVNWCKDAKQLKLLDRACSTLRPSIGSPISCSTCLQQSARKHGDGNFTLQQLFQLIKKDWKFQLVRYFVIGWNFCWRSKRLSHRLSGRLLYGSKSTKVISSQVKYACSRDQ